MKKSLLQISLGAALCGFAFVPALLSTAKAHADGFSATINVGDDDEAHFHFGGDHHRVNPKIWQAANALRNAKHALWDAGHDFGGHRDAAINAINHALDELKAAAEYRRDH